MSDGPFTWEDGKLVPLTEESKEALRRTPSEVEVSEPEVDRGVGTSAEERRRFREHTGPSQPWIGIVIEKFLGLFGP